MNNVIVSEDAYFKSKADEIEEKIHSLKVETKGRCTGEDISKIIYLGLKEVARDQRYACVDAVNDVFYTYDYTPSISTIEKSIQNAQIKDK